MLRPLYDWALRLPSGRFALPALAGVAVLARRERAWLYAGVCTAASVLGGCIGYAFGYFASGAAME